MNKNITPKLSVVMPVINEKANIGVMVKVFEAVVDVPHEILVIYDSPKDNTIPVVKILQKKFPNLRLVKNMADKGVGNAIKTGAAVARGKYILIFAADEVGPVLAVEDMLYLIENGCDLVSCTRYAHGGRRLGGSMTQRILSVAGNFLFKTLAGAQLTDSTTGIKMFRKDFFEKIKLDSSVGWAVVFELTIKSQIKGLKFGEVPIISIDRLYGGKSTFKIGAWMKEYMKLFLFGLKNFSSLRKKNPVSVRIPKTTPY